MFFCLLCNVWFFLCFSPFILLVADLFGELRRYTVYGCVGLDGLGQNQEKENTKKKIEHTRRLQAENRAKGQVPLDQQIEQSLCS